MIEKEKLDGVLIETTTHARAWITLQVLQMGVDAYIEKPMCLTIEEGKAMVAAAKRHKCVTQVGTQQRSIPLNNYACDLIQQRSNRQGESGAGARTSLARTRGWISRPRTCRRVVRKAGGTCGPTPLRCARTTAQIHRGWSRWDDYDAGGRCFGVSGWGTHSYDQVQRAIGTSDTGPVAVMLEEPVTIMETGKFEQREIGEDETGQPYYRMAKLIGPRARVKMWYANGVELRCHLDGDRGPGLGCIVTGEDGKIEVNRDKITSNPPGLVEGDERPKLCPSSASRKPPRT